MVNVVVPQNQFVHPQDDCTISYLISSKYQHNDMTLIFGYSGSIYAQREYHNKLSYESLHHLERIILSISELLDLPDKLIVVLSEYNEFYIVCDNLPLIMMIHKTGPCPNNIYIKPSTVIPNIYRNIYYNIYNTMILSGKIVQLAIFINKLSYT
jgi:hypothetical protein